MHKLSKNRFKQIKKLTKKKYRHQENLTIVEGSRLIDQLCRNNLPIEILLVEEEYRREFTQLLNYKFVKEKYLLSKRQIEKITSTKNPQPIAAICKTEVPKIQNYNFLLFLDGIRDPGNLGTIFRTAAAAGISGIVLSEDSCERFNPKVIRASMGTVFSFPSEIKNTNWLKNIENQILITALENSENLFDWCPEKEKIVLVIGSEAHGVSEEIKSFADKVLKIPLSNNVESLNAAIAAGISIFTLKDKLKKRSD